MGAAGIRARGSEGAVMGAAGFRARGSEGGLTVGGRDGRRSCARGGACEGSDVLGTCEGSKGCLERQKVEQLLLALLRRVPNTARPLQWHYAQHSADRSELRQKCCPLLDSPPLVVISARRGPRRVGCTCRRLGTCCLVSHWYRAIIPTVLLGARHGAPIHLGARHGAPFHLGARHGVPFHLGAQGRVPRAVRLVDNIEALKQLHVVRAEGRVKTRGADGDVEHDTARRCR